MGFVTRPAVKPMNTMFVGVMAGVSLVLAGFLGLLSLVKGLLGQVELSWDGAWFVLRSILLIGLYVVSFRYFRAPGRDSAWARSTPASEGCTRHRSLEVRLPLSVTW